MEEKIKLKLKVWNRRKSPSAVVCRKQLNFKHMRRAKRKLISLRARYSESDYVSKPKRDCLIQSLTNRERAALVLYKRA